MLQKKTLTVSTALLTICSAAMLIPHFFSLQFLADAPTQFASMIDGFMAKPPVLDAGLLICAIVLLRQSYRTPQVSKAGLVLTVDAILLSVSLAAHLISFVPVMIFGL